MLKKLFGILVAVMFVFLLSGVAIAAAQVPTYTTCPLLTWGQPTTNTNGSPLTDLTKYNIYVATTSGGYSATPTASVNAPNATPPAGSTDTYRCTIANPTTGTQAYFAVVTAVNAIGLESARSNEAPFVLRAITTSNNPLNLGTSP